MIENMIINKFSLMTFFGFCQMPAGVIRMLDTNAWRGGCIKTGFDNIIIYRILRCSVNDFFKYTKLANNYIPQSNES